MNPHTEQEAYRLRNLEGFEGDGILRRTVEKLIKDHGINNIVETGTYLGGTTKLFSKMVNGVQTIESNQEYFNRALLHLADCRNVLMYRDLSENILGYALEKCNDKTLIWLDAHWMDSCPLMAELAIIARSKIKPIICIHDFKVPGRPFGFDSYKGQPFTWEWIEKSIRNIYGKNFTYFYNSEAEGAQRGCIFILPT